MNNTNTEEENHLIEAIVFTTDFLSCNEEPLKRPLWNCANSFSAEAIEADGGSRYSDDGSFGLKRRQLISYKNADDLARKVDALFHRKRSKSAGTVAEIRDDLVEEEDCCRKSESTDDDFFSNLQRRIDDATSTCASTNPSLSQDELNHWYSSSWSSFTYYGSARETNYSNSKQYPSQRSIRRHPIRKDPPSRKWIDGERRNEFNRSAKSNPRSLSSTPKFLKGVEFKNKDHRHQVNALPLSLPNVSSTLCNSAHFEMDSSVDYPLQDVHLRNIKKKAADCQHLTSKSKNGPGDLRYRRFGRKTKKYWDKAKCLFRRRQEKTLSRG